ncbi:MAG: 4-deoxy-4-formamido-L-arabinose-phosphoundecaprenol deformylase [Kiritimatiellae bacterium]|nr:4-deoxy-4-formamido-L-arabinose-phosphoundecaprenol deformylase [Kiritimatiellia bacterium]
MNEPSEKIVGLRIDVDTLRGTRIGVPALCEELRAVGITASFFFSVGPDNMGRNLWRLLRPAFLKKMLRSKAANLYGWDILLMGTAWPGPRIGKRCETQLRACAEAGHEIGFHAWDHHRWQAAIERLTRADMQRELQRGTTELTRLTGHPPLSSAAPGWRCNNDALEEKESLGFTYNSDCRGDHVFLPVVNQRILQTPQIPVTLPTYDEIIGSPGITPSTYNNHILSLIRPNALNVYTIHAEAEGIQCRALFRQLLESAEKQAVRFVPLSTFLTRFPNPPTGTIAPRVVPGREGWMACQADAI